MKCPSRAKQEGGVLNPSFGNAAAAVSTKPPKPPRTQWLRSQNPRIAVVSLLDAASRNKITRAFGLAVTEVFVGCFIRSDFCRSKELRYPPAK